MPARHAVARRIGGIAFAAGALLAACTSHASPGQPAATSPTTSQPPVKLTGPLPKDLAGPIAWRVHGAYLGTTDDVVVTSLPGIGGTQQIVGYSTADGHRIWSLHLPLDSSAPRSEQGAWLLGPQVVVAWLDIKSHETTFQAYSPGTGRPTEAVTIHGEPDAIQDGVSDLVVSGSGNQTRILSAEPAGLQQRRIDKDPGTPARLTDLGWTAHDIDALSTVPVKHAIPARRAGDASAVLSQDYAVRQFYTASSSAPYNQVVDLATRQAAGPATPCSTGFIFPYPSIPASPDGSMVAYGGGRSVGIARLDDGTVRCLAAPRVPLETRRGVNLTPIAVGDDGSAYVEVTAPDTLGRMWGYSLPAGAHDPQPLAMSTKTPTPLALLPHVTLFDGKGGVVAVRR